MTLGRNKNNMSKEVRRSCCGPTRHGVVHVHLILDTVHQGSYCLLWQDLKTGHSGNSGINQILWFTVFDRTAVSSIMDVFSARATEKIRWHSVHLATGIANGVFIPSNHGPHHDMN